MKHADFTTLFEEAAGTLDPVAGKPLPAHISTCDRCRSEALVAGSLLRAVRSDRMIAPPEELVSRAIALWRQERPGLVKRALKALSAVLVFDSFSSPLPATVRSGGAASTRRLLYRAGDFDLDLAVEAVTGGSAGRASTKAGLRGQILPREGGASVPPGARVTLTKHQAKAAKPGATTLDDHGVFRLPALATGEYRLTIEAKGFELVVDRLPLSL